MVLSIIIVNWNTRDLLAQCLDSIFSHPIRHEFEVLVVDNASTDGSPAMVAEHFPQVTLISNPQNLGFARANNLGISRSIGQAVLLLNSDTEVGANALGISDVDALLDRLASHPWIAAVGPALVFPNGRFQAGPVDFPTLKSEVATVFGLARFLRRGYYPSYPPDHPGGKVDWLGGGCLMIKRQALQAVGLLNPTYFMYSEDVDWCYRARAAGWQICYVPEVKVIHHGGASSSQAGQRMVVQLYRSKLLYFQHYHAAWKSNLLQNAYRLHGLAQVVCYSAFSLILSAHREKFQASAQRGWMVFSQL